MIDPLRRPAWRSSWLLAAVGGRMLTAAACLGLGAGDAPAETLRDAMARAYATNPELTAARARLRATDENVAIAKASGRPQVIDTSSLSQNVTDLGHPRNAGRIFSSTAQASYPIYAGGRVRNAVHAADARVVASRANLRAVEGDVFAEVVTAYMDVIRDAYVVSLNENQVKVLEANFAASKERYTAGDLTRTDVAQSEARLADARSQLVAAEGGLTNSRENYRRVVGTWPVGLEMPPALPLLPQTPNDAAAIALNNAPGLASSGAAVTASRYDIATARADRLPVLSTSASATYTNYLNTLDKVLGYRTNNGLEQVQTSGFAGVTLSVPLFQGGGPAARVRQAQALASEAAEQNVGVERAVIAVVRSAYSAHQVAVATIRSSETAVAANDLAVRGARSENSVGERTVLDVLNAQQELLNSQVQLIAARHDEYVAGFNLLNAMGRGDTLSLDLGAITLYDPLPNYRRAAHSISDFADDRSRPAAATRTTGETPVNAPATRIEPVDASGAPATESATISRPPLTTPQPGPAPVPDPTPAAPDLKHGIRP